MLVARLVIRIFVALLACSFSYISELNACTNPQRFGESAGALGKPDRFWGQACHLAGFFMDQKRASSPKPSGEHFGEDGVSLLRTVTGRP